MREFEETITPHSSPSGTVESVLDVVKKEELGLDIRQGCYALAMSKIVKTYATAGYTFT